MNINALLSPSDSPVSRDRSLSGSSSPQNQRASAARPSGKRTPSGLTRELSHSPERVKSNPSPRPSTANESPSRQQQAFSLPSITRAAAPNFRVYQPPTSHPSPTVQSPSRDGYAHNYQRPLVPHRPVSNPQMESLASLSSMQRPQPTLRTHSANNIDIRPSENSQTPPSTLINPTSSSSSSSSRPRPPIFHNQSGKSMTDLTMEEAPAQTPPPRSIESNALSEADAKTVNDLLSYLAENSYAYDQHVELINLLHAGFIAHASPPTDSRDQEGGNAPSYGLLQELRQAREAMDTRFAVGENLWDDWLSDEILLVSSGEDRVAVTELFQKAVQDEPSSVKLWQMYAGWVWLNCEACRSNDGRGPSDWAEEDKELSRELFTRDMVISVLEQAIAATQWRIDGSHVLWNRYAELVQEDFPPTPSGAEIERLREMYVNRLQFPHATWDETKQMFWSIVSKHESGNWETLMAAVQEKSKPAKHQMHTREPHEHSLRRALESGDRSEISNQFSQYLQWEGKRERKQKQKNAFDVALKCALYERALLRFPTYTDWWLDYVDFATTSDASIPLLPLIERATRHCPWSGDLWARRILQSDVEGRPHEAIEATKHRATNSGLLDVGGMEEMVKVLQQWCSFLRRYAFRPESSEDDLDTAEVGITAAIEDINEAGKKFYGKEFNGDPLYRLEAIQIKFLSEARRFQDARHIYQSLAKARKDSYDFWRNYYSWELWVWGYDRIMEKLRVETPDNGPNRATVVLQEALSQRNLDWPDKVLDMYLQHFQQHESGKRLQAALIDARDFSRRLTFRRQKEDEEAAVQQPAYQLPQAPAPSETTNVAGEKRKREEESLPNGHSEKKSRVDEDPAAVGGPAQEASASASAMIKRDRENNTVTVKNLPRDVQELDIKKFFRDIGAPLSTTILEDNDGESATATVEFESSDDVLAAKTRNGKEMNGREVRVQSGTQSTLYVANYPPEHDETAMRKLFDGYGEIVSVRFPSLKFNNRRRFCYVQFLNQDMAKAAEVALDGKMLDGSHRLVAKISDPDAKKQRSGAQAEGREIIVKNIERTASDDEIQKFFEQYGDVVNMNAIKLVNGKKTGTAFFVFSSVDEANAALAADNKPFRDRILHVELASSKGRAAPMDRARKEDIIVKHGESATPEPPPGEATNGRRGSDVSMKSSTPQPGGESEAWKTARERKIAIFNLPDTVNDARVRAAMEEHGPLVKIQIRRDQGGAIVEFANINDAFNVRQGVECNSLGEGVKTGDVADLLGKKKKKPPQASQAGAPAAAGNMRPPPISRPGQGRRGGLGFKRGGASAIGRGDGANVDVASGKARSNADFRSMFVKSQEEGNDVEVGEE